MNKPKKSPASVPPPVAPKPGKKVENTGSGEPIYAKVNKPKKSPASVPPPVVESSPTKKTNERIYEELSFDQPGDREPIYVDIDNLQLPPAPSKAPNIGSGDVNVPPNKNKDLTLSETLIKTAKNDPRIEKKLKELESSEQSAQKSKEKVEKLQKDQESLTKKYPLSNKDKDKLNKIEKETKNELKKIAKIKEDQDILVKDLNNIHSSNLAKKGIKGEMDPSWYRLPGDSEAVSAIKKDIEIMNNIVTTTGNDSETNDGFKAIRNDLVKKLEKELEKEKNNK